MKNTKIICTLGPASDTEETIEKMVKAGMNAVRLNFSHGTYTHFEKIITNLRKVSKTLNQPIAMIQDLQGPKIRIGDLPKDGISLKRGQKITLTTEKSDDLTGLIPVQYKNFATDVNLNDRILIDDGLIELVVIGKRKAEKEKKYTQIMCRVLNSGIIYSHKGINVPHGKISASSLSEKDKKDLKFGIKQKVDYIALSFVKDAKDIIELKNLIKRHDARTRVMAKIERREAIENLDEIVDESDAIMVARGDLSLEIGAEKVPLVQKEIVQTCLNHGKPVIIATQMLYSMINHPRATRAEISDTATAVLEYADGLLLSNETSVGKYPVLATQTLNTVAKTIEKELKSKETLLQSKLPHTKEHSLVNATSRSACRIAQNLNAAYLVIMTHTGYSAQQISKHRPFIPMITVTDQEKTKRELSIVWGIKNIHVLSLSDEQTVIQFIKKNYPVKENDELVIYNSDRKNNLIYTMII